MRYRDLREGMKLKTDGGFTCMGDGDIKTVLLSDCGYFYISCASGMHVLVGQINDREDDKLIGLELVE
jgi:hypothetical protein